MSSSELTRNRLWVGILPLSPSAEAECPVELARVIDTKLTFKERE